MSAAAAKAEPKRTQAQNRQFWKYASQLAALSGVYPEGTPKKVEALGKGDLKKGWLAHICTLVSGQPSSSKLSRAEGDKVIRALVARVKKMGDEARGKPMPKARGDMTITPKQQAHIEQLVEATARINGRWKAMAGNKAKMREWCKHYLKRPWPQTAVDADVAIEAFKSILNRSLPKKQKLRTALKDLLNIRDQDILTPWETRFVTDGLERGQEKWGPIQWAKLWEIAETRLPKT